jgi:hypothetical protein
VTANPSSRSYALCGLSSLVAEEQPDRAYVLVGEAVGYAASVGNAQAGAYARLLLSMVLSRLGEDHATVAGAALDTAEDLLDTPERFWGLNPLSFVAAKFEALRADDAGRLLGAWVIDQGFDFRLWHGAVTLGRFQEVDDLGKRLPDPVLRDLAPRVATLTDADILEICRATISAHRQK